MREKTENENLEGPTNSAIRRCVGTNVVWFWAQYALHALLSRAEAEPEGDPWSDRGLCACVCITFCFPGLCSAGPVNVLPCRAGYASYNRGTHEDQRPVLLSLW